MLRAAVLACVTLLAACSSGEDGGESSVVAVDPARLCLTSDCSTKTQLLDIPSAENILFSPSGRLFVSGGQNVYEITRDGAGWHATELVEAGGNFTGLALRGDVLYANGFGGDLYAGSIAASTVRLQAIHDTGLPAANGLAAGPDNTLYIVNGPIPTSALPDPKIVRLKIDPANPMHVTEQTDWLQMTPLVDFPNGVRWANNRLYFSTSTTLLPQLGSIKYVTINADGSPSDATTLGTILGLPDDFSVIGEHVLMVSYSNNQIFLLSPSGEILQQSALLSFDSPSMVLAGQPPLFRPDEILVTEKGIIGLPPTPGYGNKLSVLTPK